MGNAHLKWAFSEAAVLLLAKCPEGKPLVDRLANLGDHSKAAINDHLKTGHSG